MEYDDLSDMPHDNNVAHYRQSSPLNCSDFGKHWPFLKAFISWGVSSFIDDF